MQSKAYSYSGAEGTRDSEQCSSDPCDESMLGLFDADTIYGFGMALIEGCPSIALNVTYDNPSSDTTLIGFAYALLNGTASPNALPSDPTLTGSVTGNNALLLSPAAIRDVANGGDPPAAEAACHVVYDFGIMSPTPLTPREPVIGGMTLNPTNDPTCADFVTDPCYASPWVFASDAYGNMAAFSTASQPCPRRAPPQRSLPSSQPVGSSQECSRRPPPMMMIMISRAGCWPR